jgi:hypothetical protein
MVHLFPLFAGFSLLPQVRRLLLETKPTLKIGVIVFLLPTRQHCCPIPHIANS